MGLYYAACAVVNAQEVSQCKQLNHGNEIVPAYVNSIHFNTVRVEIRLTGSEVYKTNQKYILGLSRSFSCQGFQAKLTTIEEAAYLNDLGLMVFSEKCFYILTDSQAELRVLESVTIKSGWLSGSL